MVKKTEERKVKDIKNPNVESPFSWPLTFFIDSIKENGKVAEENVEAYSDYIKFLEVFNKTQIEKPEPTWTTKNKVRMDLHTLKLRDFSQGVVLITSTRELKGNINPNAAIGRCVIFLFGRMAASHSLPCYSA